MTSSQARGEACDTYSLAHGSRAGMGRTARRPGRAATASGDSSGPVGPTPGVLSGAKLEMTGGLHLLGGDY
ncbi:hypothetical protein ACFV28_29645 [Streptomyces sp. NPDC059720]|uniref:hypothetical protein n=1 Tax=Streptomyces sp. NPDC059720 TaxID=3346924 RepID=UPI0036B43228